MKNNQKGITLIALVITIIVLLILAGAAISMLSGENGILKKATDAKLKNEEAARDEENKLAQMEGTIDQFTEGTLANEVKKGNAKVGDVVEYTYTPGTYTATKEMTGSTDDQEFNSDGNVKITTWRILSTDNGVIKLIGDLPAQVTADNGLNLYGAKGWANASNVLNGMCEELYSGDYGTARSFNGEDYEKAYTKNNKKTQYQKADGTTVTKDTHIEPMTIGEIEKEVGSKIKSEYRTTPDSSKFEELKVARYHEMGAFNQYRFTMSVEKSGDINVENAWYLLYQGDSSVRYWSDDRFTEVSFKEDSDYVVKYRLSVLHCGGSSPTKDLGGVMSSHMYNPVQGDQTDLADRYYFVRPVVTLKSGLQFEYDETNSKWVIKN